MWKLYQTIFVSKAYANLQKLFSNLCTTVTTLQKPCILFLQYYTFTPKERIQDCPLCGSSNVRKQYSLPSNIEMQQEMIQWIQFHSFLVHILLFWLNLVSAQSTIGCENFIQHLIQWIKPPWRHQII